MRLNWRTGFIVPCAASLAAGFMWSSREPLPYHFLGKFKVLEREDDKISSTVILEADIEEVIAAISKEVSGKRFWVDRSAYRNSTEVSIPDEVCASDNLNAFTGKGGGRFRTGTCVVLYRRRESPFLLVYSWMRGKFDKDYEEKRMWDQCIPEMWVRT